jgi:hypothetical protein
MRRWFDLLLCALIGTWFGVFVSVLYLRLWRFINSFWPESLSNLGQWFFLGTSLLLLIVCVKISGIHWRQFRYFWSYPPVLVSVLIAWTLAVVALACFPKRFFELNESSVAALVISTTLLWIALGFVIPLSLRTRRRPIEKARGSKNRETLRSLTIDELVGWLADERPIALRVEDYFGADDRASQVWEAIQTRRSRGSSLMQTVVIEGPFGSGKTSIIELLTHRITQEQPEKFIVARVNAWGFSSSAARQFVLEQAIEALRTRVDCFAVRGLPQAYLDALSRYAKWLPAILYPWASNSTPVQRLQALTPLLRAIDAHLIIVVEDSDRTGSDFDPAHLQAMLNDFRQVEHLSFILTVGSTARIDYPKLAEQIITVARLPAGDSALLLDRIRDQCRKSSPSIDLIADTQNRPDSLSGEIEATRQAALVFSNRNRWPGAVAQILNTPRYLKFTLGSILRTWERLKGEVDVDELVIMTTLRHGAGPAFSFILRRALDLRFLKLRGADEKDEDKLRREQTYAELRSEWQDAVVESKTDSGALDILLCNLFPKAFAITREHSSNQTNRVQSLNSKRGEVYLERIVAGSVSSNAVRDQDVLTALLSVAQGEAFDAFADQFTASREFAEIAIFFDESGAISVPQAIRMEASAVLIRRMSNVSQGQRLELSLVHDLFSKWQSRISRQDADFPDWATAQISQFVPSNLLHATELWFDLVRDEFIELEKQVEIRQMVVQIVRDQLSTLNPEQLARSFRSDFPYTLGRLIRLDRRAYPEEFLTKYSDWAWMSTLLLEAAERFPEIVGPQLIQEFGNYGPHPGPFTWFNFRDQDIAAFFGENRATFYALMSQPFTPDSKIDANFKRLFPLASKQAKEWRSS